MNSTSISPWFWSSDTALWNYGDAISVFLVDELIYDFFPYSAQTHIIGSVIFDGILKDNSNDRLKKSLYDDREVKAVFWGCGIRDSGSLSSQLYSSVEFLAVRGPVSASDLRLGGDIPLGDPALLLPALYKPRRSTKFANKSVCVPHYNDSRSDDEIRSISGCDLVLRPAVKKDKASIKAFIDAICSARFVLAGAMHAAVTAAAYGIPFGFWDSGNIDIPTKWEDISSLLGIPCAFFEKVDVAVEFYDSEIAPTIAIPSLWPLVCVAPGFLKMAGMLKILKYEIERQTGKPFGDMDYFIDEMVVRSSFHDRIALLAHGMNDEFLKRIAAVRDELSSTATALETERVERSALQAAYDAALAVQQRQSNDIDSMAQDNSTLKQQLVTQTELLDQALADKQVVVQAQEDAARTIAGLLSELAQKEDDLVAQAARAAQAMDTLRMEHERQILTEQKDKQVLREALSSFQLELEAAVSQAAAEREAAQQALADAESVAKREHDWLLSERETLKTRIIDLTGDNMQLKSASAEIVMENDHLKRLSHEHGLMIEAFRAEIAYLSEGLDEQRRQSDRRVQNLAMEHEEQMLAQHEAYRALETNLGRLQEEMVRLIDEGNERTMQANMQFDAIRRSLEQNIAQLTSERDASNVRNATLERDIASLHGQIQAADAEAQRQRQQVEHLHGEIQHVRAQADALRDQSQALVAQHVALRADMTLNESESAAKAARAEAALSRYWQLLGQGSAQLKGPSILVKLSKINKKSKIMRQQREIISEFLEKFSESELNLSKSGRKQRITQYLMGVTPDVEDFPIFNRDIYLFLNPDVADSGIEPFVHFIQNGQWESRIIHPTMDIPYYISRYPEVDKFKISAVEHYFKFGVSKNYDPSSLFSTKWYFDHYTDVKMLGINPVIHYLRYPGCQPHPDFDSDYYRKQNLDVVRHGINPLVHYALWGRQEGRRPTAYTPPTLMPELPPPAPDTTSEPVPVEPIASSELTAQTVVSEAFKAYVPPPAPAGNRPLVVMMDAFYPRPDEDSGSLDQVNFIRIFQNLGYDVAFIALLNFGDGPIAGEKVSALGAHCVTATEFASIEEYLFLNQERISVLFLSRVHFGGAWIDRARSFCPKARILFNTVDLHHIREEREAALRGDADSMVRAEETKRLEYACIMAADASIVVSEHEKALLASELPSARVAVVPLMREIPRTTFPEWQARQHLAFVGGFQHQPNIDAVTYFLDEIWPIVQARRPDLIFHVIGSHLPETLKVRQAPNVEWVGYVPEIEPWLDRIRLTVAPLRYGAGAKGKVVSSLLNGVPCVATSVAAEGMGLTIGQDIVSCHNPQDFAKAIIEVHDDPDMWNKLSRQGFETVSRAYSIEYAQRCVESVIN